MKTVRIVRQYLSCKVAMFFFTSSDKNFAFTLVHNLFSILRAIFLTALGLFHASLILLKVFVDRS